jgi:guanylate kinase
MLFVVTGPSGSGKSTILRCVFKDLRGAAFSVSHTTRPPRESERNGREYHFVDEAEFKRMIGRQAFVEWAVVHGHYYGTSKAEIAAKSRGADVLLDIDVQGARQVREHFPEAVFIFILPPKFAELKRRLRDRGEDDPATIALRLKNAKREIRDYKNFEYVLINDRLDRAVLELEAIILGARCRTSVRRRAIRAVLDSFR